MLLRFLTSWDGRINVLWLLNKNNKDMLFFFLKKKIKKCSLTSLEGNLKGNIEGKCFSLKNGVSVFFYIKNIVSMFFLLFLLKKIKLISIIFLFFSLDFILSSIWLYFWFYFISCSLCFSLCLIVLNFILLDQCCKLVLIFRL